MLQSTLKEKKRKQITNATHKNKLLFVNKLHIYLKNKDQPVD